LKHITFDLTHEFDLLLLRTGALAAGVPGEVAGYWAAHQRYGKLPWARLVRPSALLAENGIPVNNHLFGALKQEESRIQADSSMWSATIFKLFNLT
jgi:gamma-glutamyltranspeptidase / glutathione hydrolase / leukotriene-C4 hydrolase